MRKGERLSGVGRETIRFYIREGLLPEPERPTRNSASYSDEHLARLTAIKRLQEARFLPLAVIRTVLDGDDAGAWLRPAAFPGLDRTLHARFHLDGPTLGADAAAAQAGLKPESVAHALAEGVLHPDPDGRYGPRQVAIMRVLGEMEAIGFSQDRGFPREHLKLYADMVGWIVDQELRLFVEQTAGRVDEARAADMAEKGVAAIDELLALLRTDEVLRRLGQRRRVANDNG